MHRKFCICSTYNKTNLLSNNEHCDMPIFHKKISITNYRRTYFSRRLKNFTYKNFSYTKFVMNFIKCFLKRNRTLLSRSFYGTKNGYNHIRLSWWSINLVVKGIFVVKIISGLSLLPNLQILYLISKSNSEVKLTSKLSFFTSRHFYIGFLNLIPHYCELFY